MRSINGYFSQLIGRDPTREEADHIFEVLFGYVPDYRQNAPLESRRGSRGGYRREHRSHPVADQFGLDRDAFASIINGVSYAGDKEAWVLKEAGVKGLDPETTLQAYLAFKNGGENVDFMSQ